MHAMHMMWCAPQAKKTCTRKQQILKLRQKATLEVATCEPRLKTLKQEANHAQQG